MGTRHRTLGCLAILALALIPGACDDANDQEQDAQPLGRARSFALGFSSLPPELTEESYASAFELAASAGEVILIQRPPPWEELLSGGVSDDAARTTQREKELAEQHDLDLFVAIDAVDTSESGLASLPADVRGGGFTNDAVRQAFVAYAQYVAVNYQPQYLALGVEVNSYQRNSPEDFDQFVTLYSEAYDAVKESSPDTLVFPTFQLEEMAGRLPADDPQEPQWYLIRRFEPKLDLLVVSSYPSLVFSDPADMPNDYFTQITSHTERPIAIAEMGFATETDANGEGGESELRQASFLQQALEDAQRLQMPLVIWFVGQDPSFTGEPPFSQLQHIGLLRADGSEKAAWSVWLAAARRPLEAPTAEGP